MTFDGDQVPAVAVSIFPFVVVPATIGFAAMTVGLCTAADAADVCAVVAYPVFVPVTVTVIVSLTSPEVSV